MLQFSGKPAFLKDTFNGAIKGLNPSKSYTVKVVERSKRSIEQNKLLWRNIGLIATETGADAMEVYADILEAADAQSEIVATIGAMPKEMAACFRAIKFLNSNSEGFYFYKAFAGSSKYTIKQCTILLEKTFDIMASLGIRTNRGDVV